MADHDGNHRCLEETNVPIAFILTSRWQDGAESLGIETTSCFCRKTSCDDLANKKMSTKVLGLGWESFPCGYLEILSSNPSRRE